jgi:exodeoxyribonuclease-5
MLNNHITSLILNKFEYEPTPSQLKLINGLGDFIMSPLQENILVINGFAGTGKTSLISALVKTLTDLKIETVLMAPTGRAAKVFSSFSNHSASTIHRKIYRQKSSSDGQGSFLLNWNKHKDTLFIVDEASMIANQNLENSAFGSGRLLEDLINFVMQGNNCKLILMGDTAQLPPVGLTHSPALDPSTLESYNLIINNFLLDDVVRQNQQSGILLNATHIRQAIQQFDETPEIPLFETKNLPDIRRIQGEELIETIPESYDRVGIDETMVICRTNKRTNLYNKGIRGSVLWREEELTPGDLLVVVKNNYFWFKDSKEMEFIANGEIVEVIKIRRYEELHGFRFATAIIRFVEHSMLEIEVKLLMDSLHSDAPSLTRQENEKLYTSVMADYADEKTKKDQFEKTRNDQYFNALQVKFAYAMTCHKAQGGQWKRVFIDQGMVNDEAKGIDYLRWLYTAITRATEQVYLVNFPDNQFA